MLWELLLCGEPLVVMATSPPVCSYVVQALVNLIYPLEYSLDYRPFFTIHDPEFKEYTGRPPTESPPPVLLGVTNPFFAKALQHWPHIIRISADAPSKLKQFKQLSLQFRIKLINYTVQQVTALVLRKI